VKEIGVFFFSRMRLFAVGYGALHSIVLLRESHAAAAVDVVVVVDCCW
jgi:hypothetical protein